MRIHYDAESDCLYIRLSDSANVESEEVALGVVLDFNSDNRVIGIEIENASTIVDLDRLETDFLLRNKLSA